MTILKRISRIAAAVVVVVFGINIVAAPVSYAQVASLPAPGTMVGLTSKFEPLAVKGIKLYPDNPFQFDFIVDTGDTQLTDEQIKAQGEKLVSYFLASLTTPEKEMWVNLSPFEKDRIIPASFGQTEMGTQLLAQDYLLKQIMATALYPEKDLGKEFWQKVYDQAAQKFGSTNVPVSTFNKVWIVPDKAVVYENSQANSVFVVESTLKVMLERDYLAANKQKFSSSQASAVDALSSQVIKEVVIPALEKEVNEGKNFAPLRQVYQSLILAAWYKKNLKDNVIAKGYVDRNKILGVDINDKNASEKIYQRYLQAYRKGVYNYIKEEIDPATQTVIPRKYFSGGFTADGMQVQEASLAMLSSRFRNNIPEPDQARVLKTRFDVIGPNGTIYRPSIPVIQPTKRPTVANQPDIILPIRNEATGTTLTAEQDEQLKRYEEELQTAPNIVKQTQAEAEYSTDRTAEWTRLYRDMEAQNSTEAFASFSLALSNRLSYYQKLRELLERYGRYVPANPFAQNNTEFVQALLSDPKFAEEFLGQLENRGYGSIADRVRAGQNVADLIRGNPLLNTLSVDWQEVLTNRAPLLGTASNEEIEA